MSKRRSRKDSGKQTYYQQLLNTAFSTQNISFINQKTDSYVTKIKVKDHFKIQVPHPGTTHAGDAYLRFLFKGAPD